MKKGISKEVTALFVITTLTALHLESYCFGLASALIFCLIMRAIKNDLSLCVGEGQYYD